MLAPGRRRCDTAAVHIPVDRPRVCVVIPARDAAATIARAVASAQAQQPPPDEVLVVDDASHDNTAALARMLGARVLRLARHGGAAAARNAGVAATQAEIIGFLDADDEWLPGKLAQQLPRLAGAQFVACTARLFGSDGADLGPLYGGQTPPEGPELWRELLERNTVATSTVLVWRRAFLAVGGFDARLEVAEDQDLWIRLALAGRLAYVPATLVHMHCVPGSVSGVGTALGARQQIAITLPMIERHIAANRARLTAREIRRIRGDRLLRAGGGACWTGAWAQGARLLLRAAWLGHRPGLALRTILATAPPLRWLRRR
jgi:glycosyltransferase involved in cell wall biosynthesis